MFSWNKRLPKVLWIVFFIVGCLALEACRTSAPNPSYRVKKSPSIKNNKPNVWNQRNPRIKKFLKRYGAANNRTVKLALQRAQPYLPYIHRELRKRKMPPELAYLPMLESSFNPKAVSRTGARGMWQFTKATAGDYGLEVGWLTDDRLDWRKSTKAAIVYLEKLGKKFNYNWELALASYNGGPGYISRSMKKQGTWNFWELRLREEPHEYVPKFIAMLQVAKIKYPRLYRGKI